MDRNNGEQIVRHVVSHKQHITGSNYCREYAETNATTVFRRKRRCSTAERRQYVSVCRWQSVQSHYTHSTPPVSSRPVRSGYCRPDVTSDMCADVIRFVKTSRWRRSVRPGHPRRPPVWAIIWRIRHDDWPASRADRFRRLKWCIRAVRLVPDPLTGRSPLSPPSPANPGIAGLRPVADMQM